MFLITLFISFISFVSGYDIIQTNEEFKEEESAEIIYDIFYDIIHEGIDKSRFLKMFLQKKGFNDTYNKILNTLTNQSLTFEFINSDSKSAISQFLKSAQPLHSFCPYIKSLYSEYKEMIESYRPILLEIAPNFCKAFNLDLNTLTKLYDYILINDEQDGVYLDKILQIIEISPDQIIPQFQVFLSFFDGKTTIYEIFKTINAEQQYLQLVSSLDEVKISTNNTNIFSLEKVTSILSNTIDLLAQIKFNAKQLIEFAINPFLIKSNDKISIYDRAQELYEFLAKVDSYSEHCSESDDFIKCFNKYFIYELVEIYISGLFEDVNKGKTDRDIFLLVKQNVLDFANKKIKISEQNIPNSVFNLLKLYIENELKSNYSQFKDEKEFERIIHHFDSFENIFKKEEQENVENLFNALGISEYYESFKLFVDKLNEFETFEEFFAFYKTEIIEIAKPVIYYIQQIQQKHHEKHQELDEDQKLEHDYNISIKHYNSYTNQYKHVKQFFKQYQQNCILNKDQNNDERIQNYEKNAKYYEQYVQNYKHYKQNHEYYKQGYQNYIQKYKHYKQNYNQEMQNYTYYKQDYKHDDFQHIYVINYQKICISFVLFCVLLLINYKIFSNTDKTMPKEEKKPNVELFIPPQQFHFILNPRQEEISELPRNHHHHHHHHKSLSTKSKKN